MSLMNLFRVGRSGSIRVLLLSLGCRAQLFLAYMALNRVFMTRNVSVWPGLVLSI